MCVRVSDKANLTRPKGFCSHSRSIDINETIKEEKGQLEEEAYLFHSEVDSVLDLDG